MLWAKGELTLTDNDDETHTLDEAAAAFGLVVEQMPEEQPATCWLWPENLPVFLLWQQVQTQWVVAGMGGLIGLNYSSIALVMNMNGLSKRQQRDYFPLIQAMESAVINALR